MLTVLLVLHCTVAGGMFVYLFFANKFFGEFGQAFGLPGKVDSLPMIILQAIFWEITLGLELIDSIKKKF
jgi:hypothetical protein